MPFERPQSENVEFPPKPLKIKSHREQINEILEKYKKKFAEYRKDYAFLAEIFTECLIDLDECVNAED